MSADLPAPSRFQFAVVPLVGSLGHAEVEQAAALLIRACQVLGDRWQPVHWDQLENVGRADLEAKAMPFAAWLRNPFFRPDFAELVDKGWARWTGAPGASELELLPRAVLKIAERHALRVA